MVAVINSLEGNHQDALAVLENLFPIAHSMRRANPQVYYDYLNSFAVELTEAGRLQEAEQACRITLASPFANAYPEWRETWQDVLSRGYRTARSFVSLNHSTLNVGNVLLLPLTQRSDSTHSVNFTLSPFYQQASVTSLQEWKRKMVKEPDGDKNDKKASEDLDKMSNKELLVEILQRTSKKDMSEKKLRKILEYVIEVESQPEG
jgi:hypothetical protein